MPDDFAVEEQFRVVAGHAVETCGAVATLHPVIALVTGNDVGAGRAGEEVIAFHAGDVLAVGAAEDEVVARATEQQVQALAAVHHVVAAIAMVDFASASVGAAVGNDVVAVTALDGVDAVAAFETVVAAVTPDGVVALATDDGVIVVGATEHHVLAARVLEPVVHTVAIRILTNDRRTLDGAQEDVGRLRVRDGLARQIHFEGEGRGAENGVRQVGGVGCAQVGVSLDEVRE